MGQSRAYLDQQQPKGKQMNERTEKAIKHEELHLALTEDISNVISKHLPSFDNNIEADTWNLLMLFLDETINQLGETK